CTDPLLPDCVAGVCILLPIDNPTTTAAEVVDTTTAAEVVDTTTAAEVVDTTTDAVIVDTTTDAAIVDTTTAAEIVDTTTDTFVDTTTDVAVVDTTTGAAVDTTTEGVVDTTTGGVIADTTTTGGFVDTTQTQDINTSETEAVQTTDSTATIPDQTTDTASATASETSSDNGRNPASIGSFRLLGCFSSINGFPTFFLQLSSGSMTQELCAAQCDGFVLFGTHRGDCWCGDVLEDADTNREDDDECDIPCPGDDVERCGGETSPARRGRLARRQNVAANILLIIYIDASAGPGATVTLPGEVTTLPGEVVTESGSVITEDGVTVTLPGDVTTLPGEVVTEDGVTVTAPGATVTDFNTITDVETVTTTFISTVTESKETFITTVTATVVCYSGHCNVPPVLPVPSIVFVFQPYPGEDCANELVYLPSPCSCAGGVEYVPHYCDSTSCTGKTVYKPEKTEYSDDKICYQPTECTHDQCETSGNIYKPYDKTQPGHEGGYPKGPEGHYGGNKGSESGHKGYDNGAKPTGSGYEGSGSKGISGGEGSKGSNGYPAPEGGNSGSNSGSQGSGSEGSHPGGQGPSGQHPSGQAPSGQAPSGQSPSGGDKGSESGYEKPSGGESAPGDKPVVVSFAGQQVIASLALVALVPIALAMVVV
ncbi:hypothetical protein FLONG3_7136, partial [Fusarium longipes]